MGPQPEVTRRPAVKMSAVLQARMIRMLCDGPCTIREIAEDTGLHYMTVQVYLRELHRVGAVHIASWDKDSRGRDTIKVYGLGVGKDAKRQRMTDAQRQAASRARRAELAAHHALVHASSRSASSFTVGLK